MCQISNDAIADAGLEDVFGLPRKGTEDVSASPDAENLEDKLRDNSIDGGNDC